MWVTDVVFGNVFYVRKENDAHALHKMLLSCSTMCISLVWMPFRSKSMVYGHVYKYMYDGSTQ